MNDCCNDKSTNYCSDCGERLEANCKNGLVVFLSSKVKASRRYLENACKNLKKLEEGGSERWDIARAEGRVERNERKVAKWTGWLNWVQENGT